MAKSRHGTGSFLKSHGKEFLNALRQGENMDLQKILKRIKFDGEPRVNLETLTKLQEQFILEILFENLDIHYGPTLIPVDPEKAYHKIIERGRGGFCYELNALFATVLREIGFQVDVLACFHTINPISETNFSHMFLRVSLNHDYIVDVGEGRSFRIPLRIDGSNESHVPEGITYRIGPHIEGPTLYLKKDGETFWTPRYHFNPVPRQFHQFISRSIYVQTDPGSLCTKHPLVTKALPDGRMTLTDESFKVNKMGTAATEIPVPDEKTFFELLASEFNYPVHLIPRTRKYYHPREETPSL